MKLLIYVYYSGHAVMYYGDTMTYPVFNLTQEEDRYNQNLEHWLKRLASKHDNIYVIMVFDSSRMRIDKKQLNEEADWEDIEIIHKG